VQTKPERLFAQQLGLRQPSKHLDDARQALSTDSRAATRHALLALLSFLEGQRWASLHRSFTNHEVAQRLPRHGAPQSVCESVKHLMHWYDGSYYSLEPVTQSAADDFIGQVQRLVAP
jgi:hypothetical protein